MDNQDQETKIVDSTEDHGADNLFIALSAEIDRDLEALLVASQSSDD